MKNSIVSAPVAIIRRKGKKILSEFRISKEERTSKNRQRGYALEVSYKFYGTFAFMYGRDVPKFDDKKHWE